MSTLRKAVIGLLTVAMLAFPVSVFAGSTTGNTPETLTVAATISATFPAAQTYTLSDQGVGLPAGSYQTPEGDVTIVGSNNPTGVSITAKVDPWVGPGSITVATSQRVGVISGLSSGSGATLDRNPAFTGGNIPAGTFVDNTTSVLIASSTGPLAGRAVGLNWGVASSNFTVAGSYASAVHWTASTNP